MWGNAAALKAAKDGAHCFALPTQQHNLQTPANPIGQIILN